jgi:ribonuclease III
MDSAALERLQERLGVRFRDMQYLERALTHRSAAAENSQESNERLEFLGDSVVGLVISENLFRLFPNYSEGDLAKSKAYVVSETALAEAAQKLGLEEFLVMSPGEAATGGRRRRSILADAFEALVAAIYLDCGIRQAQRVVRAALKEAMRIVAADQHRGDYKSALQEQTQARARRAPLYRIVSEEGRDHDKTFLVEALVGDRVIGEGTGKSKKEAEQSAAQNALENLAAFFPEPPASAVSTPEIGVQ